MTQTKITAAAQKCKNSRKIMKKVKKTATQKYKMTFYVKKVINGKATVAHKYKQV